MKDKKTYSKIFDLESNLNLDNLSNKKDETISKVLLTSIVSLTIINLVIYITRSSLSILYIPIMVIVFILLGLYNNLLNTLIKIEDNEIIIYNKKGIVYSTKAKNINEMTYKYNHFVLKFDENSYISFTVKNNSNNIYEMIKNGIKEDK